jgi:hypothetical protein
MRKTSVLFVCMIALVAFAAWAPNVNAFSSLYNANCADCHAPAPVSCAGCHAHGVHSTSAKNDIDVIAMTDLLTYAPGETVTVSISGGYRDGWVRTILYDETGVEVNRSTGPTGLGDGPEFFGPIDLTAPAPTTPGTYTWTASWYGNEFDLNEVGGTTVFGPNWRPDTSNPGHGEEIVETNSFEVVAGNQPPVADPNGPYPGVVDVAVMFDGTGSDDPDGTIVSYEWDFGDGSPVGTGESPTHAYTAADTYTVTLTVTDDGGLTNMATTIAEITAAPGPECEGDFNGDGTVDDSDLVVFSADFGRTDCGVPTTCPGDFNNDGDVDGSDLAIFAADFGRTDCP